MIDEQTLTQALQMLDEGQTPDMVYARFPALAQDLRAMLGVTQQLHTIGLSSVPDRQPLHAVLQAYTPRRFSFSLRMLMTPSPALGVVGALTVVAILVFASQQATAPVTQIATVNHNTNQTVNPDTTAPTTPTDVGSLTSLADSFDTTLHDSDTADASFDSLTSNATLAQVDASLTHWTPR